MQAIKFITLMIAIFIGGEVFAEQESGIPVPYPLQRYQLLMEKSPFIREAPGGEISSQGFSKDLVITGHFCIGGVIFLNVLDKKTQTRMSLSSEERDPAHLKVVSLHGNDDPFKVEAVIRSGNEVATITFDRSATTIKNTGKQTAVLDGSRQSKLAKALKPPVMEDGKNAPLPVALMDLDTDKSLTDDRKALFENLKKEFLDKVGQANEDPTSPEYMERWRVARRELDASFKAMFGVADFQARQREANARDGTLTQ
ncbi:MAG: hypothetical protein ABIP97_11855 [Chthoniobacterales bacterium]